MLMVLSTEEDIQCRDILLVNDREEILDSGRGGDEIWQTCGCE